MAVGRRGGHRRRTGHAAGPVGRARHRRAHPAGARPGPGRADRRALPDRPNLDRGRAGDAGPRPCARAGGRGLGLDQPPVLQRDRHRRLPDLLPAGPASARRERPPGPGRGGARRPDRRHHLGPLSRTRREQAPPLRRGRAGRRGSGDPAARRPDPAPRIRRRPAGRPAAPDAGAGDPAGAGGGRTVARRPRRSGAVRRRGADGGRRLHAAFQVEEFAL
ncbi:hypothetical protein D3C73_1037120 [compost metagenome]